jgi:hypothetical protein
METAPCQPELEKECVDVSCPERIRMYYATHSSHRMQKHKFDVMYHGALFVISILVSLEHEK